MYNIPEEGRYVYVSESEKQNLKEGETATGDIEAILLPEEICDKIGVHSLTGEGVYLALVASGKSEERDQEFMAHIFE